VVESAHCPEIWRPCWLATPPTANNLVELHVRVGERDPVGATLVGRVKPGDRLRLGPAQGHLVLDERAVGGELLLVADDTGVAPMRALLAELRRRRDRRRVQLFWVTNPNEEPYDLAAISAYANDETTVLPVAGTAELAEELAARGPWSRARAYVAGTPTGVAAALTTLAFAGVPAGQVRHDQIGADD
jgi:NAD(P)H-flavin reductase